MGSKRISKELAECTASPPDGMTIRLANESDLHKWHCTLSGPAGTVYSGGAWGVVVTLPADYPFKAPVVTFATRIYHPNITNDDVGAICIPSLKPDVWKPASKLRNVLQDVRQLLAEPNPDDPLETRIADQFRSERPAFDKTAREYVERYARGPVKFVAPQ